MATPVTDRHPTPKTITQRVQPECLRRRACFLSVAATAAPPTDSLWRVRRPYHSWGASLMLDVLFVGVTVAVFVVLALIVNGVEKL
jgi:hypothetical protein